MSSFSSVRLARAFARSCRARKTRTRAIPTNLIYLCVIGIRSHIQVPGGRGIPPRSVAHRLAYVALGSLPGIGGVHHSKDAYSSLNAFEMGCPSASGRRCLQQRASNDGMAWRNPVAGSPVWLASAPALGGTSGGSLEALSLPSASPCPVLGPTPPGFMLVPARRSRTAFFRVAPSLYRASVNVDFVKWLTTPEWPSSTSKTFDGRRGGTSGRGRHALAPASISGPERRTPTLSNEWTTCDPFHRVGVTRRVEPQGY